MPLGLPQSDGYDNAKKRHPHLLMTKHIITTGDELRRICGIS